MALDMSLPPDCVDPRRRLNRPPGNLSVRTPAGGLGLFTVRAAVETAKLHSGVVTGYDVLRRLESREMPPTPTPATVHTGGCLRLAHALVVLSRMARPYPSALAALERLTPHYSKELHIPGAALADGFRIAAEVAHLQAEVLARVGVPAQETTINRVRGLHPAQNVVTELEGPNTAEGYLIIHEPRVGFDDRAVHNHPDGAQLYVDTLGSTVDLVANGWGLEGRDRVIAAATAISGSIATRAAVNDLHQASHGAPIAVYDAFMDG